MSGPGGAQNLAFDGGLHQIAQRLAEELPGKIRLGEAVQSVEQTEAEVLITTQVADYRASQVIMTLPPALTREVRFCPLLPSARIALLERQITGSCIKAWIAYDRPFWRDSGLNGTVVLDNHDFSPVFDVTPTGSDTGFLVGFFDGAAAPRWSGASQSERKTEIIRTLGGVLGPAAKAVIGYAEWDWTREDWSRGCYGSFMPPAALSLYGQSMRRPHGRVNWAGTEVATVWSGYVEGAISSGQRAAMEVLYL